jgi:hypothetical protein
VRKREKRRRMRKVLSVLVTFSVNCTENRSCISFYTILNGYAIPSYKLGLARSATLAPRGPKVRLKRK